MPLPFLNLSDDEIFPFLNFVIAGYACLIFLPRWKFTSDFTLCLVVVYSVLYFLLLLHRFAISEVPLPPEIAFDTLEHVSMLFSDRAALMAGWDHYIAFDLFVARHVLLDSQSRGIPHLMVVSIVPLVLLAGPAGFAAYMCLIVPLHAALCGNRTDIAVDKKEKDH